MTLRTYRYYQQLSSDIAMTGRMWASIFRHLFGLQILLILIFFMVTLASDLINFELYKYLAVSTFLLYPRLFPLILRHFHRRSRQREKQTIRGSRLVNKDELQDLLPHDEPQFQLIPTLSIPDRFVVRHFFITGSSGSGKTNIINQGIDYLISCRAKAIIYDIKGDLVAKFYNPRRDYLYNPFDKRSLIWNVFESCTSLEHFNALAAALIPETPGQSPFWANAARQVFSAFLVYLQSQGLTTNDDLCWNLLYSPTNKVYETLSSINSPAASFIQNPDGPQAQGVMSTLHTHAHIFRFMLNPENKECFSLKDWINNTDDKSFLFLPVSPKNKDTLKGILSLLITTFINEVVSRPDNQGPEKRIYFILDELATLNKIESFPSLPMLARSKNVSLWLGIQEKNPLDVLYGKLSNSIINQCSCYLIGRMNDAQSAEHFSKVLGDTETEMLDSTYSSKVHYDNREAGSFKSQRTLSPLVLPSEISTLEDLNFYIKLLNFPVTKTKIEYREFPNRQPAFVENEFYAINNQTQAPRAQSEPQNDGRNITQEREESLFNDLDF